MGVKCLAHEHNAMSPVRSRTRTARSGVERTNHEATVPPSAEKSAWVKKTTKTGPKRKERAPFCQGKKTKPSQKQQAKRALG